MLVVGFLARRIGVAVDADAFDADAQQSLADALDDLGAGWVERLDVAAEQYFAGQAECPAFIGQLKALLLEDRYLRLGKAFGGWRLAAAEGE